MKQNIFYTSSRLLLVLGTLLLLANLGLDLYLGYKVGYSAQVDGWGRGTVPIWFDLVIVGAILYLFFGAVTKRIQTTVIYNPYFLTTMDIVIIYQLFIILR